MTKDVLSAQPHDGSIAADPQSEDAGAAYPAEAGTLSQDVRAFHRRALSSLLILTTTLDGSPRGMALNAFASVSLEPAVVLVSVSRTAGTFQPLFEAGRFALNLLASDQADLAAKFARSGGAEKFDGVNWRVGRHGSPILDGTCGYVEALVENRVDVHTHSVFFGQVLDAGSYPRPPLAYLAGRLCDSRDSQAWDRMVRSLDTPDVPPVGL
jgi:flavin reductase (DIM6/NTAB) family NADH-FMN oxidoreductase RutF